MDGEGVGWTDGRTVGQLVHIHCIIISIIIVVIIIVVSRKTLCCRGAYVARIHRDYVRRTEAPEDHGAFAKRVARSPVVVVHLRLRGTNGRLWFAVRTDGCGQSL